MPPGGRRKRRSLAQSSSVALIKLIKIAVESLEQERDTNCQVATVCSIVNTREKYTGVIERVLTRYVHNDTKILWQFFNPINILKIINHNTVFEHELTANVSSQA